MKVPEGLKDREFMQTGNKKISVVRFWDNIPSKIYTNVCDSLLVFVLKGKKRVSYRNFDVTISAGEFAFFQKNNYIMSQILEDNEYESLLIFVNDDILKQIQRFEVTQYPAMQIPYYKGNTVSYMTGEIEVIGKLLKENKTGYDTIIDMKIRELLQYILIEDSTHQFAGFLSRILNECTLSQYMEEHYESIGTIEEIAIQLNMSVSTFKRKFQEVYHCTPHKWLNDKRLDKAKELLCITDYSATDICFICGFQSLTTFINQFKGKYGTAPGQYRSSNTM
jgi:AraC-type DNA-binding domain-containing proteins